MKLRTIGYATVLAFLRICPRKQQWGRGLDGRLCWRVRFQLNWYNR